MRVDNEGGSEWVDWMEDTDAVDQETQLADDEELSQRRAFLENAMGELNDREKRIFAARRLAEDPMTLEELSKEFDVSRERIRQIEVRAFEKVQAAVQAAAVQGAEARPAA